MRQKGQILIVVLIFIVILSLVIVSVTLNVQRNRTNVAADVNYSASNNAVENNLLKVAEKVQDSKALLAGIDVEITDRLQNLFEEAVQCSKTGDNDFGGIYICTLLQSNGDFTGYQIYLDNKSSYYRLSPGGYYDVILDQNSKKIDLDLVGEETSYQFSLVYGDGLLSNVRLNKSTSELAGRGPDKYVIDLKEFTGVNPSEYKYLRVQNLARDKYIGLTLSSDSDNNANLPAQVLRIESIVTNAENGLSSPVSSTQLLLSPAIPGVFTSNAETASYSAPVCGDNVTEGIESCDDGDNNGQPGFCPSDCSCLPIDINETNDRSDQQIECGSTFNRAHEFYACKNNSSVAKLQILGDNAVCLFVNGSNVGPLLIGQGNFQGRIFTNTACQLAADGTITLPMPEGFDPGKRHCGAANINPQCAFYESINNYANDYERTASNPLGMYEVDLKPYLNEGLNNLRIAVFNGCYPTSIKYNLVVHK